MSALQKGAIVAELMAGGVALMRQNLRRRHPTDTEAAIDGSLRAWLQRRADPVPGDVAGPVRVRSVSG